jgi:hypothetical protein
MVEGQGAQNQIVSLEQLEKLISAYYIKEDTDAVKKVVNQV